MYVLEIEDNMNAKTHDSAKNHRHIILLTDCGIFILDSHLIASQHDATFNRRGFPNAQPKFQGFCCPAFETGTTWIFC